MELPTPTQEVGAQTRLDVERTLGIPHPPQSALHHARMGQWNEVAWDDHAGIDEGTAVPVRAAALDHRDPMPLAGAEVGDAKADDSGPDDEHMLAHARGLMPQQSGSAS